MGAVLGRDHVRIEATAKVTGVALYSSDRSGTEEAGRLAHAALVTSAVAKGRIIGFDHSAAETVPGLLGIFTHRDFAGSVAPVAHLMAGGYANSSHRPLESDAVAYAGQIVALVVAETVETAAAAAAALRITYEEEPASAGFDAPGAETVRLADLKPHHEDLRTGDAAAAFSASLHRIEARYETPTQHHNPIEMFTTRCAWEGDTLTVHEPTRFVGAVQHGLAAQLGLDPARVRVVSGLIGGHFGSKFALSQHTALVALAAKRLGRPVSLVPTRRQCFTIANYRPETRHDIRLGADAEGRLTALVHEAEVVTSRFDPFAMEGADVTGSLYACPAIRTEERATRVDRNTPGPMRAPPEVPYLFALESAMDEMAWQLGLDPIELRRRNDTATDPVSGKPFTSRPHIACFEAGARAFGWERRRPRPGALRDGPWRIGLGCAASVRPVKIAAATLRVRLAADGSVEVAAAHHEIGNGITTLLAMGAAEWLGVPVARVSVHLGDTDLPPAGISGGSSTTTSLMSALSLACAQVRDKRAVARAGEPVEVVAEFVPKGGKPDDLKALRAGHIGLTLPDDALSWAFGAQFAEVHVHAETGEIRVPRLTGAFAAGRVLNPLTALSQLKGGMIWGLGSALLEETVLDGATYRNPDLAEYLVPTSADVEAVEALIVPDPDERVNPLGVKGLGELGIIGVNAAIANAVYHATGRRQRRLPIRIENMLA